jgi:hypothetical protein
MPNVSAKKGPGKSVIYADENGRQTIKKNGSPAWRNNNPGNIIKGGWARRHGSIGDDGKFAIFPDVETGRKAKKTLLTEKYGDYESIRKMIRVYAPKVDNNDPEMYADHINKWTGLDVDNTKMKDLKPEEMEKLLDAMQRQEGFQEGTIEIIETPKGKTSIPKGISPPQPLPSSIRDRWPWDSNTYDDGLADRWKNMLP